MHIHCINQMLHIPDVDIVQASLDEKNLIFKVVPTAHTQPCPICLSDQVKRNGVPYNRLVHHLPMGVCPTYLRIPAVSLQCQRGGAHFVWHYDFVAPKNSIPLLLKIIVFKKEGEQRSKVWLSSKNPLTARWNACLKQDLPSKARPFNKPTFKRLLIALP